MVAMTTTHSNYHSLMIRGNNHLNKKLEKSNLKSFGVFEKSLVQIAALCGDWAFKVAFGCTRLLYVSRQKKLSILFRIPIQWVGEEAKGLIEASA